MSEAPPPQNCCGPCSNVGFCRVDVNCCLECHMAWEEQYVRPYLPAPVFAKLQSEHNKLEQEGFPPAKLLTHSIWETKLFEKYGVPENILGQIRVDHSEYEQGRLRSRAAVMR
jgi:hypothetical protein